MTENCGERDLKSRLVDKSFEAVLALETINRITIQYRIEAFCYLICPNAWELLLKAKILDDEGDLERIYYQNNKNRKPRRSLSLRSCLNQVMPIHKDPVRRNIELIEELRDESVHLVVSQIPRDIMGLFQAGVINYHNSLNRWFEVSLTDRVPAGMMSIVYDMRPEQSDLSDARLRREMSRESAEFLSRYCSKIRQEFDQLQRPAEFSIGIDYHLARYEKEGRGRHRSFVGPNRQESNSCWKSRKTPAITSLPSRKSVLEERYCEAPHAASQIHMTPNANEVYSVKSRSETSTKETSQGFSGAVPANRS